MLANSVLVTGCDKGIGLEFIKQLAAQTKHLFAGCLSPDLASDAKAVADKHSNVILLHLDVTNEDSIQKAIVNIEGVIGEHGLNCVINNAGVLHFINSIENLTAESLLTTYVVNTIGPAMVIKACLPLLQRASLSFSSSYGAGVSRAAIVNISSNFGSMEGSPAFNRSEKLFYGYRNSKIALNMMAKSLSIDLKKDKILVANLNPGWVQTDMGGPDAPQTKFETVEAMIKVIAELNAESEIFYNWNGDTIPW